MVNTAFDNYLDQISNLRETLETPILMDKTTLQQTLPISLNISNLDMELLTLPTERLYSTVQMQERKF